ncbi:MAG: hypothetical protein N2327_08610 [Caldimicrobium sp.]|nr:hypothetical protein [Caldimicrobium sp.]
MLKTFFVFLLFLFIIPKGIQAFSIKAIQLERTSEGYFVLSLVFSNFPTQELILSLKRQSGNILILYEFEIYRDRLLGEDLLYKDVYFQRAGYIPELNKYFLEDNWGYSHFNRAEDLISKIASLYFFPLNFKNLAPLDRTTYLLIKVTLKYPSHFNRDLRYTPKEREVILKTSKRYALSP